MDCSKLGSSVLHYLLEFAQVHVQAYNFSGMTIKIKDQGCVLPVMEDSMLLALERNLRSISSYTYATVCHYYHEHY